MLCSRSRKWSLGTDQYFHAFTNAFPLSGERGDMLAIAFSNGLTNRDSDGIKGKSFLCDLLSKVSGELFGSSPLILLLHSVCCALHILFCVLPFE